MSKNSIKKSSILKIPKSILIIANLLSVISTKLLVEFTARLFTTPLKYRIPKRELEMDRKSKQESVLIPRINKSVVVIIVEKALKKFFWYTVGLGEEHNFSKLQKNY